LSLDIRSRIKSGIDGGVAGLGILLAGTMSAVIVGAPIVVVLVLVYLLTVRLVRSARRRRLHEATRQKEGQANRELGPRGESGGT
jgi:flagellar biosynthesis/type III secretory pathway M-ring protein FliF/YscJ